MSGLYTRLVAGALFPLHERLKGHDTVAVRRWLEETQWWDRERLEALQLERLKSLLEHAQNHVPYYRRQFTEHGFDASTVHSVSDLEQLPLLSKADIRADPEAFKSNEARNLARCNTGGSSGEPLIFWIGKERVSHDVAAKWRATRWWGVDIGDPEIVLWGSPVELGTQDWLKGLRDRALRSVLLPAFEMSDANVRSFVDTIRYHRPRMLFGYPSALVRIVNIAEDAGIRLDDVGVGVAFVTAERLYDHQREQIARAFGCHVANGYGGRDAGFVAHECPEGGMHVTAEDVVVEIIGSDGRPLPSGHEGEIVITHLATRDFPFIRYRTGDVGALEDQPCGCGRGLPRLREIQGRETDFVVAQDGTVMHGLALIYVVRDRPGIQAFKIIQESLEHTRLLLVTNSSFDNKTFEAISADFQGRLGDRVRISIEQVNHIPTERSGKYRYVVSKIRNAITSEVRT